MRFKSHKQKVKSLKKDKPYTHEEAERVAGRGSYVKPVVTEQEKALIQANSRPEPKPETEMKSD